MKTHTKHRTTLSIDRCLYEAARSRGIKLSPLLEDAIQRKLSQEAEAQWLRENQAAIEAYNTEVAEHGAFSAPA